MISNHRKLWIFPLLFLALPAYGLDQITHPYQSVRTSGMGGTKISTGLYEENFFGNPARVMANPNSRFTIFDITPIDINGAAIGVISPILAGKDPLTTVTNTAGSNLHEQFEIVLPAYYLAATGESKFALAVGLLTSVQSDVDLRQSFNLNMGAVVDVGPAVTLGYKMLQDGALAFGLTTHLSYRVSTNPNYSLTNYISGTGPSIQNLAGDGSMIDFDFGTTYKLTQNNTFNFTLAAAVQNILGGSYSNLPLKLLNFGNGAVSQPTSVGLGISAVRTTWGNFSNTTVALEFNDLFNNGYGSIFRLIHLGAETQWRSIMVRLGLNQGYWTAGLGINTRIFTLNLASYGEELGLNVGQYEDRRWAFNFGFHI